MSASREEHMKWVKERALEELDADPYGSGPQNALTSVMSDLRKHPETRQHAGIRTHHDAYDGGGLHCGGPCA